MRYESDLTDKQWELIAPLFIRTHNKGKHLEKLDKRELVNAVRNRIPLMGCWIRRA